MIYLADTNVLMACDFHVMDDPGNNQRLSLEEFDAALQRLDALVKKFAKPDAQPLSDYAISREGIFSPTSKIIPNYDLSGRYQCFVAIFTL